MRTNSTAQDPLAHIEDGPSELDLAMLAVALWRRKLQILVPTVLAFIISAIVVQTLQPEYKATASLLLQPQESSFTRPVSGPQGLDYAPVDDQAVQSQVQLLKSRDLARKAIAELSLVGHPEFDPMAAGVGPIKAFLVRMGFSTDPFEKSPEDRVLDRFQKALTVYPIERSRVITVEFSSRDPDLAARAANVIADLYIAMQRDMKRGDSLDASEALSPQIEELRANVAKSEAAVEEYRSHSGLFTSGASGTLSSQQLADVSTQLSAARAQQSDAQTKARLIDELIKSGRPIEVSDVTNSELIRRLIEQRVTMRTQLAMEERTLLSAHPRIKELRAQIEALERQIVSEAQRTVRSFENDAKIAGARVDSLQKLLDSQKSQSATSNEQEVKLRALEREAKSQRDLLEVYLSRYREAAARASLQDLPADARIISRAVPPTEAYFPRKAPIVIIATLAVFVLSTAFVAASEIFSGRALIRGPIRVVVPQPTGDGARQATERALAVREVPPPLPIPPVAPAPASMPGVAALSASPDPTPSPPDLAPPAGAPVPAEREAGLATLAARPLPRPGAANLFLFVGRASPADISAAAAEVAARMSARGLRVVLVSLDPAAAGPAPGLGDLLVGEASFMDVIHRDPYSRVHMIPAGRAMADGDAATLAARLGIVVEALSMTYDGVLFDGGALPETGGRPLWSGAIDRGASPVVLAPEGEAADAVLERASELGLVDPALIAASPAAARAAA